MRLTVVSGRPVHYHAPLFRRLAGASGLDVEVLYASSAGAAAAYDPGFQEDVAWDRDLLSGYRHRILERGGNGAGEPDYRALYGAIRGSCPDVIWTNEYARPHTWVALAAACREDAGIVFRGETDLKAERPWYVRAAKRLVLPPFYGAFDAVLYSYEANRRYCRHYGVPEEKLFFCPSAVDGEWLREQAAGIDRDRWVRERLELAPGRTLVLFVGKLIPRKRPLDLVRAFATAPSRDRGALVFVGSGEMEEAVRRTAREAGVGESVRVTGFLPQREVARWCAAADLLALPSELDPSPKVLHEAMEFGLPVVVADAVGTVGDLVRDGVNGRVHRTGDIRELSDRLEELISSEGRRRELGAGARETAERWSLERAAEGVRRAVRHAAGEESPDREADASRTFRGREA